ncbi:unnamed protein product [Prorocentrum cordatum]|uniref:Uncharacterized protein n=1 Tax=Prorocentrum cordatum TaxID=2364126 RepID=A0ABN9RVD9_9DINO|nr:unnamed protein product [Polarella glacialis]
MNSPTCLHHYWPLCSQMLPVSGSKVLLFSDAAPDTWKEVLDQVFAVDGRSAATRLKWKPSRYGGRPIESPSATTMALAAARRKGHRPHSTLDHITEVIVRGELGREGGQVLRRLMTHLSTAIGLETTETDYSRGPRLG